MKVLNDNVLILKTKPEYKGILQGITSDENTYGKVLGIGESVSKVAVGDYILLDWHDTKNVKNDLYVIKEENMIAILEDAELVDLA